MAAEVCEIDEHFEGTKCNVDKRILFIWMVPAAISILGFWLIFIWMYLYYPSVMVFSIRNGVELLANMLGALLLIGIPMFVWSYLRYRAMTYNITLNEVIVNEGILNKKRTLLPFVLIQDIYIKKPIIYRLVGLSIVEFETAGSARGVPEGYLPGIANAEEMVKELLVQVRKIRKLPDVVKSEDKELLLGILHELRAMRQQNEELARKTPRTSNLESEINRILGASLEGGKGEEGKGRFLDVEPEGENIEKKKKKTI
jgi:uncharacterized membrane protein YdbT with pleckstrin-like domain